MKRFHVHVSVDDVPASIRFYTVLFAAEPAVVKGDYAKSEKSWVDDPQGVQWEAFLTTGESTVYGSEAPTRTAHGCCS